MWQRMRVLERCASEECMRENDVNVKRHCVERGLGNMVMTPKEVGKCMLNVFGVNYKAK